MQDTIKVVYFLPKSNVHILTFLGRHLLNVTLKFHLHVYCVFKPLYGSYYLYYLYRRQTSIARLYIASYLPTQIREMLQGSPCGFSLSTLNSVNRTCAIPLLNNNCTYLYEQFVSLIATRVKIKTACINSIMYHTHYSKMQLMHSVFYSSSKLMHMQLFILQIAIIFTDTVSIKARCLKRMKVS